jgi:acetyltransferase-like isoleucine patch superfamily enzyme
VSDALAPPAALPPARPTLRHRLRARRAAARPGVVVTGLPLLGDGVVLDVAGGATVRLGDGCVLGAGTRIHARNGAAVAVGAGAVLGERCALLAHAGITVGARSSLADGVVLVDFEHAFDDPERPVREQGLRTAPVVVGERCRLGPGAVLERGARLAPGTAVPANTVVPRRPAPPTAPRRKGPDA